METSLLSVWSTLYHTLPFFATRKHTSRSDLGQCLQFLDHVGDHVKAALPESGRGDVDAGLDQDFGRAPGATIGQDLEILGDKRLRLPPCTAGTAPVPAAGQSCRHSSRRACGRCAGSTPTPSETRRSSPRHRQTAPAGWPGSARPDSPWSCPLRIRSWASRSKRTK